MPKNIYDEHYFGYRWLDSYVLQKDSYLHIINDEFKSEIFDIKEAIEQSKANEKFSTSIELTKLLKTKQQERIIVFLSRKNIIPRYGFPVDNVDLITLHEKNNNLNKLKQSQYTPACSRSENKLFQATFNN